MSKLQKFTTEYIPSEDRIRIFGQVEDENALTIWLTQRILQRLVPVLTGWLENQGARGVSGEVMHSFAQQAARTSLPPQEPVAPPKTGSSRLVSAVDISRSAQNVRLTFRDTEETGIDLTLNATQLRQWLGILHGLYDKASWPKSVWPTWMQQTDLKPKPSDMIQ